MAVSYRQGCGAAAATALSDGMVLARTRTLADEIDVAYVCVSMRALSLTDTHASFQLYV